MGTRHLQTVITKEGETKIQQYGQWDGYPGGQGVGILQYLRTGNLDKYQENLKNINQATKDQIDEVNRDKNWTRNFPYLSRDCGCDIHKMIEEGKVKFVMHTSEEEAKKWCEGFYTIDFSKNEFTSEFYDKKQTFKLDSLPSEEEYLKLMRDEEEEDDDE